MKKQILEIKGMFDADVLTLCARPARTFENGMNIGDSVILIANSGGLHFQFDMTPSQAIELAAALVDFATED